ncbi:Flp pilus assembly CpaE family ATPase [Bradyrhizobium sp. GM6.1]
MTRVHDEEADDPQHPEEHIAPVPRISVQAFCETAQTLDAAVTAAGQDRRLAKAHLTAKDGGLAAAIEVYETMPTPNVIVIESDGTRDILEGLDDLAGVCDPGTRVVVIGNPNDTAPYRELVRRGVNDYVVGPVETLDVVRSICSLFSASETIITGRVIAVVGAKGGVGASTVAHNVAWTIARDLALDSVVIDLDLAFGTAGLDYKPGPGARHRQCGAVAGSAGHGPDRASALQMHRASQPACCARHP